MVAVCRYQYEQWKRGGHLYNKAINGILNHKTVILPDPQIRKENKSKRKEWEKEIKGEKRKGENSVSTAYGYSYIWSGVIIHLSGN